MKHLLLSAFLISICSVWSAAQRPQTDVETRRPGTSVSVNRPQTLTGAVRPATTAEINHPVTQTGAVRAQTNASAQRPQTTAGAVYPVTTVAASHPETTVEVIHPQTNVEVIHPQTPEFLEVPFGASAGQKGGKSVAATSAQATTSMSNFTPKQAKDFTAAQKAAPLGGGDNNLGNDTNVAEKDAANKASMLGKQNNQNMDVDPNLKTGNLAAIGAAVEKKVEEKKKKK